MRWNAERSTKCLRSLVPCGLVLLVGCAGSGSGAARSAGPESDESIQLTIQNEVANPITVFVWWQSGQRVRLGDVAGVSAQTFTTPVRAIGLWFEIEDRLDISSRRRRRPDSYLPVNPGEHLEVVTGRNGLIRSVRSVRSR